MEYDYQGVTCPNFETLYVEAYKNEPWQQRIESSALLDIARSSLVAPLQMEFLIPHLSSSPRQPRFVKCPRGPVSTFAENLITDWTRTKREKTLGYTRTQLNISILCRTAPLVSASGIQPTRRRCCSSFSKAQISKTRHRRGHLHAQQMPHQASVIGPRAQGPARYPSRVLDSLDNWLQRFRAMDTLQPAPTGEWRGCAWPHRTAPVTSPPPQCRWLIFYRFQSRPGAARDWPPVAIFPRDIPARVQRSPGHLFTGSRTKRDMKTATTA